MGTIHTETEVERLVRIIDILQSLFLLIAAMQIDEDEDGAGNGNAVDAVNKNCERDGGCVTHITPSTMGKVSVLPETGFWHFAELAGWQDEEGTLARIVREMARTTAVPRSGMSSDVHADGMTASSSSTLGNFMFAGQRCAVREQPRTTVSPSAVTVVASRDEENGEASARCRLQELEGQGFHRGVIGVSGDVAMSKGVTGVS